ncbi:MAG: AAA domain-containing protein [Bacteroidetes bacterium]|nr:AAA domain-containing protein [Bacteroidota bacterium]
MPVENTTGETNTTEEIKASVSAVDHELDQLLKVCGQIRTELGKVIVGQTEMMDLMLMALLVRGHLLLEGVPGVAKTLTAKLFAKTIDAQFSRIQFTPDLMPSDILGTNVYNAKNHEFEFKPGPIFADLVVVDEINRAPAKTQAAMFEVMQEIQVSVDGVTRKLGDSFMVLATQNPVDNEGTYNLPEAQLDRFLFKVNIDYPTPEEELEIFKRFQNDFDMREVESVQKIVPIATLSALRRIVEQVVISEELIRYIRDIILETRSTGDLYLGASTRAGIWMVKASKAAAAIAGRRFVTPDDIRRITFPVLNHRIIVSPQREMEGVTSHDILQQIIEKVEVPR